MKKVKKSERNEDNFNPSKVVYKGKVYYTGNRYKDLIELYETKFYMTVKMSKVRSV